MHAGEGGRQASKREGSKVEKVKEIIYLRSNNFPEGRRTPSTLKLFESEKK